MHPGVKRFLSEQASTLSASEIMPGLRAALQARSNAVLIAPPGAGKTTLMPLALLGAGWLGEQRIVMLEPRRLAAQAAAGRMASLIGEEVGGLVGFRTRVHSAVSARTRIEVVTEGLMLRRLLGAPTQDGVGCVIFDEVHERSLDCDLALAFCLDLQRTLRPELRLLAMSATPDTATLLGVLGGEVIESTGRLHPVKIRTIAHDVASWRDLPELVARELRKLLTGGDAPDGDILVFLPGVGEINRTRAALAGLAADILPLHGEQPPAEQDLVLRPAAASGRRRIVLATSIAQTSLTVPGVRIVVDGGWRRAPRHDPSSGLSRLETIRISKATAIQRAGRAGREAPGLAIQLWNAAAGRSFAAQDHPEILDADLAAFTLDRAVWCETMGTPAAELTLPDRPPAGAIAAAGSLLEALGAFSPDGAVTAQGRRMAMLGAHPRLAAMMLAARNDAEAALAADLAALLEERDPLRARSNTGSSAPQSDIGLRLALLGGAGESAGDRAALARIRQAAAGYRRRLGCTAPAHGDAAALLSAAFPDRIAQRRGERGSFRLSQGGSARLGREDLLADAGLLVAASLQVKDAAIIRLAAALDPDDLPQSLLARTTEQTETTFDSVRGAVVSRVRLRLGTLVLRDRTITEQSPEPGQVAALLAREAAARLRTLLQWSDAACQFQARVAMAHAAKLDATLPDLSDPALSARVAQWLVPALAGRTRLSELGELDLFALLREQLDASQKRMLDRELPTHLMLPGNRPAAVDYTGPVAQLSAKAQAFYGMRTTPLLAGGRVALRLVLLSPAGRPAAITGDLASFWSGAWNETRRALRGRYPKHDWPENPGG